MCCLIAGMSPVTVSPHSSPAPWMRSGLFSSSPAGNTTGWIPTFGRHSPRICQAGASALTKSISWRPASAHRSLPADWSHRAGALASEMLHEPVGWNRPSHQIALHLVTALILKERQVGLSLNPLRDHAQAEGVPHRNDCGCNRGIIRLNGDLSDEGAVDLQGVQRKMLEIAERRVAGTEVVHSKVETHGTQRVQRLSSLPVVVDQHAFSQLQAQVPCLQATDLQGAPDRICQTPLELPTRQIDADPDPRESGVLPRAVLEAGTLQDPLPHWYDQSILFRDGNELGWQ